VHQANVISEQQRVKTLQEEVSDKETQLRQTRDDLEMEKKQNCQQMNQASLVSHDFLYISFIGYVRQTNKCPAAWLTFQRILCIFSFDSILI